MRHIEQWLMGGMLMLLLLLTACASEPTEEPIGSDEKPVIKLYLFAPNNPIVTRTDEGYVDATEDENRIKTIDVWVFEKVNSNPRLVTYTHVDDLIFDAGSGQKEITMEVSKEFAERSTLPRVDIYVVANVTSTNCGLSFDRNTSPTELEAALIEHKSEGDFFGLTGLTSLTNPIMSVPDGGLPMSGFQKNQQVTGSAPVFSVNKNNVKLVRAVSKVRFIFSFSKAIPASNPPTISDLTVTLNDGMLPKQEYLFLNELYDYPKVANQSNIPTGVEYEGGDLISIEGSVNINDCVDPAAYAFDGTTETGQSYEDRINNGLTTQTGQTDPDLSELGRFYLRESDKQLKGTINYKVNGVQKTTPLPSFSMASAGDFTRNHTWIVYGYFLGSGELKLNVVDVKEWNSDDDTGETYNW